MRILIVVSYFHDATTIASQRPRAIARELERLGHDVTVLTAPATTRDSLDPQSFEVVELRSLGFSALSARGWALLQKTLGSTRGLRAKAGGGEPSDGRSRTKRRGAEFIRALRSPSKSNKTRALASLLLHYPEGVSQRRAARRELESLMEGRAPYDVVIGSFGPLVALNLARFARDAGYARRFVADFRDPMNAHGQFDPLSRLVLSRVQDRYVRDADLVTAVSVGLRGTLLEGRHAKADPGRVAVVRNGHTDAVAVDGAMMRRSTDGVLRLGYFGTLARNQDLSMLFSAMADLAGRGDEIEFHYAGRQGHLVSDAAREAGVADLVHSHGLVSFERSGELQASMDVLVVSTWNTKHERGVLTGKLPEYLGRGRPLVALVAGDTPGAEITQVVEGLGVGISCEYARGPREERRLTGFLARAAAAVKSGEPLLPVPDYAGIAEFAYPNIVANLSDLLRALPERARRA